MKPYEERLKDEIKGTIGLTKESEKVQGAIDLVGAFEVWRKKNFLWRHTEPESIDFLRWLREQQAEFDAEIKRWETGSDALSKIIDDERVAHEKAIKELCGETWMLGTELDELKQAHDKKVAEEVVKVLDKIDNYYGMTIDDYTKELRKNYADRAGGK